MKNVIVTLFAALLVCLLLCGRTACGVIKRDTESVPYEFIEENQALEEEEPQFGDLDLPTKRHLCRRYFIYNPVKGRCMPTLMMFRNRCSNGSRRWDCMRSLSFHQPSPNYFAFRAMRSKSLRSFPNPQAWAHFG